MLSRAQQLLHLMPPLPHRHHAHAHHMYSVLSDDHVLTHNAIFLEDCTTMLLLYELRLQTCLSSVSPCWSDLLASGLEALLKEGTGDV
jgi:hypothetical protein